MNPALQTHLKRGGFKGGGGTARPPHTPWGLFYLGGGRLEGVIVGQDGLELAQAAVAAGDGGHAVAGEVEAHQGQLRQLWGGKIN